jgi:ribose transport system substrate-binding protein
MTVLDPDGLGPLEDLVDARVSRGELLRRGAAAGLALSVLGVFSGRALAQADASSSVIAIVSGGPHPYFAPWGPGTADAARAFHVQKAEWKVPTAFTLNDQNQLIDTLVVQGFNAFGVFPDDVNGTNGKIAELAGRGIPVLSLAACVAHPSKAPFCISTDVYNSAYQGTNALIRFMGGKGAILHGTGLLIDPNTKRRIAAVKKAVAETHGKVKLVQTLTDIDDPQKADKAINSFLAGHRKDITGIVTTAFNPSVAAAKALVNLGDKRIKMVGIDDDPAVLDAIRKGFVNGTMAQNPYGQAYLGVYVLDLLKQGWKPKQSNTPLVDSGTFLVTKAKVGTYKQELKKITLGLVKSFKPKYLTR